MPSTPDSGLNPQAAPSRRHDASASHRLVESPSWQGELKAMVAIISGNEPLPHIAAAQIRTIWMICVLAAGALTLNYYSARLYGPWLAQGAMQWVGYLDANQKLEHLASQDGHLIDMLWWGMANATGYLIPALLWLTIRREKIIAGMGWTTHGLRHHWPIYLIMAGVMVPALYWATHQERFLEHYPFYKIPSDVPLWPRFLFWEVAYTLQFFALESFFRGFLIGQLGKAIGCLAVPVAMVPYCMIHFGKPLPETIASIIAGLGLGTLSYRSGCIWPGAVLHIGVAITMDMASLAHQGRFS